MKKHKQRKNHFSLPVTIGLAVALLIMLPATVFLTGSHVVTKQYAAGEVKGPTTSCTRFFNDSSSPALSCLNGNYCVIEGDGSFQFRPNSNITRNEAVAIIARYHVNVLQDWSWVTPPTPSFTDVAPTDNLYTEIETAKANSFISGTPGANGTKFFNPYSEWLYGFHGVLASEYNFANPQPTESITRQAFIDGLFAYGASKLTACAVPTVNPTTPISGNGMTITFTAKLHGIGNGGETSSPNAKGNMTLKHPQRGVTITLSDQYNSKIPVPYTTMTFDPMSGVFKGSIDVSSTLIIRPGFYTITLKADNFLHGRVPGIFHLTTGNNQLPPVTMVAGDANNDDKLDIQDYNMILDCFSSLKPAKACTPQKLIATDSNDDGIVNEDDLTLFVKEMYSLPFN